MSNMRIQLLFIFCLCGIGAISQTYHFRMYAEEQGLPQSYIYSISQSGDGHLYLSTGEGLSLFDGNKFTNFTQRQVAGNIITGHFIDSRGNCWAGHLQNGASYLKNGTFNALKNEEIEKAKVTGFAEDKQRNVWIATLGGGLFKADSVFGVKPVKCPEALNASTILFNREGRLLVGTDNGLLLLDVSSRVPEVICNLRELVGKNVKQAVAVHESPSLFWLSVEGEGIYGIKQTGDCFSIFAHLQPELQSEKNNIACIYNDRSDNLWVSLFGEGLRKIVFNGPVEKMNHSIFKIDKSNGLKNTYIQSVFEDFEGNMWFGSFGGGLMEKPVERFSFYSDRDGISDPDIKKVIVDKKGDIWMGHKNGLSFFNPETYSRVRYNGSNGFVGEEITALYQDGKGMLWIGTANSGIYTFDTLTRKFVHFSERHRLSLTAVNAIIENNGELVAATNEGILIYDLQSSNIQFYTTTDGLLHNSLINVFYDNRHRLWVSSHGAPPYYIANGKVTVLKNINGLNSFNINAVTGDKTGAIWIATEGDGIFRHDESGTVNFRVKAGLSSDYCYGILVDDNNAVWVMHKNGLSMKGPADKNFHAISVAEGLLFTENNLNAACKDNNGNLWFGTAEGLVQYNAEIGRKSAAEPRLAIQNVKMNEELYPAGQAVEVKYGYYSVHISFLAISLTNPEKIRYRYRLLGIDSVWHITDQRFVDYPNLSDGNYTFEVHACNSEGVWTRVPDTFTFTIRVPVWKKVWFYVFLLLSIVSVTYVIIIWRTQSLQRSQRLLRIKVKQKTFLLQREKEAAEKIKVELENKNKDIMDSISYARRIQDSLLPPDETLGELFDENYFIFYRPKDIVSGDFYWAARVETGGEKSRTLSLAAVADCTGHGVPGAFLSIVASSFLKQSLTEKFVNNTGDVLDYLNKNITATLNQSSKARNRISDGMDLAIIAIDYRHNKLHYAGANNSIYIFRKAESSTQLFVLKPTKQSIGSGSAVTKNYESQIFDLQAGDTIYMFSDGYPDQFGGEKDKKFNYRRFRELLGNASEMPMSLQRAYLEDAFEDWKGQRPQTDDVCIMGLKI